MTRDFVHHDIDLNGIATSAELHHHLAIAFAFPSYYGNNWDAFDECIADYGPTSGILQIRGWVSLKNRLPHDAELLRACLDDFAKGVKLRIDWV